MANVVYSETIMIGSNSAVDETVTKDSIGFNAKSMSIQNNTQMDLNVLVFEDGNYSKQPTVFTVSAGRPAAFGADIGSYIILSAGTNAGATVIAPPGKTGNYAGPGHANGTDIGFITVVCYDEIEASNMSTNGAVTGQQVTISSQNAGLALDGSDINAAQMPSGGNGIRGWLSGIFNLFANGAATVSINPSSEPLPTQQTGSNTGDFNAVSITAANTAQSIGTFACHEVTVIAEKGNSGTVFVGLDSTVTNTKYGAALDPKDSITLRVANISQVNIYGAAGDGVSYVSV